MQPVSLRHFISDELVIINVAPVIAIVDAVAADKMLRFSHLVLDASRRRLALTFLTLAALEPALAALERSSAERSTSPISPSLMMPNRATDSSSLAWPMPPPTAPLPPTRRSPSTKQLDSGYW